VDAQTCRVIALDREIGSMTEFKQIVGRGTRVHEDTKKYYFTLIDFRGATKLFADKEFDGEPVQIYEPGDDEPMTPPEVPPTTGVDEPPLPPEPGGDETVIVDPPMEPTGPWGPTSPSPRPKIYVNDVPVTIVAERVEYMDEHGKLITESLRTFTRNELRKHYASLEAFLNRWNSADRKEAIVQELADEGLPLDIIAAELGKDLDPFDLISHIAFDRKPLTRKERATNVRKRDVFAKYGPQARAVLEALLLKYQDEGTLNIDDPLILSIPPLNTLGTRLQLVREFGDVQGFEKAVHEMQAQLYSTVA
jgi:type I restriction enzyme R subunit